MASGASLAAPDRSAPWHLAPWAADVAASAVQEMLKEAGGPGFVHLALGIPAAEWLPTGPLDVGLRSVLNSTPDSLQYRRPSDTLREHLAALMRGRGITCRKEQIFLTTGAQQGLSLLSRLLIDADRPVLLDEALYPGFRQAVETCGAMVTSIPIDPQIGTDVNALQNVLEREGPASLFFFNGGPHNPLGVSMPMAQRIRLAALATQYGMPVIEDDAYGFLSYDQSAAPPLWALNPNQVCYVGSLSKILAPALRVGWIIAPEWLVPRLSVLKESMDLDTCTLGQTAAAGLFEVMNVVQHIDNLRVVYRARRDAMLDALTEHLSDEAIWFKPSAGFFVWLQLRKHIDTAALLRHTLRHEKVTFLPGQAFSANGGNAHRNCIRLSFSSADPARIHEGVQRLAQAIQLYGVRGDAACSEGKSQRGQAT